MVDRDAVIDEMLAEYGAEMPASHGKHVDFRSDEAVIDRARKYLAKLPGAVSGSSGHAATFHAACVLVKGFELPTQDTMELLREFNERCEPPWTEHELQHKIDDAARASGQSGYLRNQKPTRWEEIQIPVHKVPAVKQNGKPAAAPISQKSTLRQAVAKAIEQSSQGRSHLIDLGLPTLNRALGGGVEFGEVLLIAARPSHGKSAIALQIVAALTANQIPCAFISEEMSQLMIGKRVLHFVSPLHETQWADRQEEITGQADTHFQGRAECVVIENCRTADRVAEEIRQLAATGVKVVVVDYVQLLTSKGGNRFETVTQNSVILRQACTETGVLLIVLAQMSRAIEGRDTFTPKVSDLRESGQLEQDADVILFLVWPWKLDQKHPKNDYTIFVSKNRNREIVSPVVNCYFEPSRQKVSGLAYVDPMDGHEFG